MAPPLYDPSEHHIGLAVDGVEYGFVLDRGYNKSIVRDAPPERDSGAPQHQITSVPGRSRWTQSDFTGGCFQREWGDDDAMFFLSKGVVPAPQASNLLTFPPVIHHSQKNPEADAFSPVPAYPRSMFVVSGTIYVVFQHAIYRYPPGGPWTSVQITAGSPGTNASVRDAMWDYAEEALYVLVDDPDESSYLKRLTASLSDYAGTNKHSLPVETPRNVGRGIEVLGQNIIVGVGQQLWMFEPAAKKDTGAASVQGEYNRTTLATPGDAGTGSKWTKIGRMPGAWRASVAYNGLVYVLTSSEGNVTQVFATDGSAILPICEFPFNFVGRTMVQYGGRLFIGGSGLDLNGNDRYAELYEVSGSTVRLVRTFQPDSYVSGEQWPDTITDLCVADGLLWFSENGKKLWCYDITTDGFFGASEIQGGGGVPASDVDFYKLVVARERLYAWARTANASRNGDGLYRIAVGGDTPAAYSSQIETSDFVDDIARKKRWAELKVLSRYSYCNLEASTDGGTTWVNLTEIQVPRSGQAMYVTKADLSTVGFSEQIRFRFTFDRGTTVAQFAELIAFTASFVYEDTQRHAWQFSVPNVTSVENSAGDAREYALFDVSGYLWSWFRDKKLATFRDVDGQTYRVAIADISETKPTIGQEPLEGILTLSLIEHAVPTP